MANFQIHYDPGITPLGGGTHLAGIIFWRTTLLSGKETGSRLQAIRKLT